MAHFDFWLRRNLPWHRGSVVHHRPWLCLRRRWLRVIALPPVDKGVAPMAIYRIFKTIPFEPEAIVFMSAAYEDALRALKLTDRQDPITELVARKIIQVAQTGEKDPIRIREPALKSLGIDLPT
jgi:hypothetical protein